MKKISTTLFIVLGFYSLSQAQIKDKDGNEFGIGAGYNQAYVTAANSNQNTDITHGFNVAVSFDHYFSNRWSLKTKVVYDQKGWANGFLVSPGTTLTGVEFRTAYITVPVMANWHFGSNRNWYLNFGPYAGFLTTAKVNLNNNNDVKDYLNSTDAGIALGIGIKIPLSKSARFFIEYDGQGGLASVVKNSATPSGSPKLQNIRGSFNIGFNF